jgi:hypothetical protein
MFASPKQSALYLFVSKERRDFGVKKPAVQALLPEAKRTGLVCSGEEKADSCFFTYTEMLLEIVFVYVVSCESIHISCGRVSVPMIGVGTALQYVLYSFPCANINKNPH